MDRRSEKRARRIETFRRCYQRLSANLELERIAGFPQHGATSRLLHSVAVAYYGYRLALFVRMPFRDEELIRGALLHDYFFYDAQDGDPAHRGHWTRHPKIALGNAERELSLTAVERDIILKHMFPLTLSPPRCREAVWVTLADKVCSVYEFFSRERPYARLRREVLTLPDKCTNL